MRFLIWDSLECLGHTGARCRKNERKLILSTDATMSYGFKAQIRTMAMRIRRWRDNRAFEMVRRWLNNASNQGTNFWWFSADQVGSKMKERSDPKRFTGMSMGKAF